MELEYVAEWFKYADMDFMTAKHLLTLHPQPLEIMCYHCQQSAEKYLKGYLIYRGVTDPPKIHNLDTLCEMSSEYDERFREIEKACSVLTVYGIQPRYPNEMDISENDMQKAIEYARQIRDFEPLIQVRREVSQSDDEVTV
jgi:HEPN domain-containing protein